MTTLQDLESRLPKHLAQWAREFLAASTATRLCPYLLAGVCDREARGGMALKPPGPAGTGDHGNGRGLMQVDDRHHPGFVGATDGAGRELWRLPAFNVLYGAMLLRANLDALKDVHLALSAYNAGLKKVRQAMGNAVLPGDAMGQLRKYADALTTGRDYGADVLRRRAQWAPADAPLEY
ncbi:transglycosylase SLT domain-containing protein [Corallococcus sp. 4LFB]|uniref:transglycosylase SLT domain-containing protein n=1 Tax=Corallococcus sp. 4LFB TaxID=3383249 RepID=UPI0039756980